ncbi:MAG: RNA-binding transcriptional accessory protein, partial [Clostridia bacterium]|nr:RNA-binding transcriptional accessory protein [Clostridia bacterium]
MDNIIKTIAKEIGKPEQAVQNVVTLLDEGNTIPFIARYRKEAHGAMDDTALRKLEDRLKYLRNLEERKQEVLHSIESQGKLTPELEQAVAAALTLAEVEDIYRPYKQKRRTRATIAKEKGLEPLAEALLAQPMDGPAPEELAAGFIDPEKGVETVEDALAGASDIIAEQVSDSADLRKELKTLIRRQGTVRSV